jgi:hypothetical protein
MKFLVVLSIIREILSLQLPKITLAKYGWIIKNWMN